MWNNDVDTVQLRKTRWSYLQIAQNKPGQIQNKVKRKAQAY